MIKHQVMLFDVLGAEHKNAVQLISPTTGSTTARCSVNVRHCSLPAQAGGGQGEVGAVAGNVRVFVLRGGGGRACVCAVCVCVWDGGGGCSAACLVATISKCKSLVACGVGGTAGSVPDLRQAGRDALAAPSGPQRSTPDGNTLHGKVQSISFTVTLPSLNVKKSN